MSRGKIGKEHAIDGTAGLTQRQGVGNDHTIDGQLAGGSANHIVQFNEIKRLPHRIGIVHIVECELIAQVDIIARGVHRVDAQRRPAGNILKHQEHECVCLLSRTVGGGDIRGETHGDVAVAIIQFEFRMHAVARRIGGG